MKKLLMAALLLTPMLGLVGCQQDASVQGDIANMKTRIATLEDENNRLRGDIDGIPSGEGESNDVGTLLARLERQERELEAANKRLAELEKKPAVVKTEGKTAEGEGEGEVSADFSDADFEKYKAMQAKAQAERDAARAKQREEQMAQIAKIAEENGLEFDPKDPRGSIMKIMGDPEKRAKAMEVMKTEMDKRRLEPLGLDEYQNGEVLRIEKETRAKISDAMKNARENGATQEEMQAQIKQIQEDQSAELGSVLTPEQLETYKTSGAQAGGMIDPGMMGGFGGMIPGFGGGGGGGRGWGGGGNGG
ncbi:MAG: hypothetical protein H6839_10520 [Planctomycetes bacterium]|nr:hypothetical protein [Planctomycetota bacterium]